MALTLSQKILARASGGPAPQPGDIVVARIDRAMSYDAYAGLLHRRFVQRWGPRARIWDPDRLVLVADHFLDTHNLAHCRMQEVAFSGHPQSRPLPHAGGARGLRPRLRRAPLLSGGGE